MKMDGQEQDIKSKSSKITFITVAKKVLEQKKYSDR